MDRKELISMITGSDSFDFEDVAIHLFQYQYEYNRIYRNWVDNIKIDPNLVKLPSQIPFLPISSFKSFKLSCENDIEEAVFLSSGTTGSLPSKHFIFDKSLYLKNAQEIFESFYGEVKGFCFLALLPSYLERSASSLVAMVDHFIKASKFVESGFYLYDHKRLFDQLQKCKNQKIPTILFGVSFALLDFINEYSLSFSELIIIETGGMKGRKKEMTRAELHSQIASGFGLTHVHSEYGMTELFSQAYSNKDGIYYPGRTMAVYVKDLTDPFQFIEDGRTGVLNVIDLANIDSCAFIETQDLGKRYKGGSFEILGRLDVSDVRGCNLMVGDN